MVQLCHQRGGEIVKIIVTIPKKTVTRMLKDYYYDPTDVNDVQLFWDDIIDGLYDHLNTRIYEDITIVTKV